MQNRSVNSLRASPLMVKYPRIILWTLSSAVAFSLFLCVPIVFSNGDPLSYYVYAHALLKGDASGSMLRTPGYPLMLIATGVIHGQTVWFLLIVQTLMAVTMPLLMYHTVLRIYPRAAFSTGMTAILCMIPYGYMKNVMTETAFMFFVLLAIYLAIRYFTGGSVHNHYFALFACMVAVMIRLSAAALFVVFLIAYGISKRRKAMQMFVSMLLVASVLSANAILHHRASGYWGNHWTGFGMFYQAYLSNALYGGRGVPALDRKMGPATSELFDTIVKYLKVHPEILDREVGGPELAHQYVDPYKSRPYEEFAGAMYSTPTIVYYNYFLIVLNGAVMPPEGDRWMIRVCLEKWKAQPRLFLTYLVANLKSFFWGPTTIYWFERNPYRTVLREREWWLAPVTSPVTVAEGASPGLVKELTNDWSRAVYERLSILRPLVLWGHAFSVFRPCVFLVVCCTLPFLMVTRETRLFAVMGTMVVLYSAMIVCLTAAILDRVVYQTFLVELMLAVTGAWVARDKLVKLAPGGTRRREASRSSEGKDSRFSFLERLGAATDATVCFETQHGCYRIEQDVRHRR